MASKDNTTNTTAPTTPQGPPPVNWDHPYASEMQTYYEQLVAQGVPADEAERIVRHAIGGLPNDYESGQLVGMSQEMGPAYAVNQYRAWQQFYDPKCPPNAPYHPNPEHMAELGVSGDTSGSCVEKPDDVPPGFESMYDREKAAREGKAAAAATAATTPTTPVTEGTAGQLTYTGNPLTDMLLQQFNTQAGLANSDQSNLFGWMAGRSPQDPTVASTSKTAPYQDVTGRLLSGGGLWWSPTSLWSTVTKGEQPAASPPPPPQPPEPFTQQITSEQALTPEVKTPETPTTPGTVEPPIPRMPAGPYQYPYYQMTPMQRMLTKQQNAGYFDSQYFT